MNEKLPQSFIGEKYTIKQVETFDELIYEGKGDSQGVDMGEAVTIRRDENVAIYSFGANPCMVVVSEQENGDCIIFHTNANEFTSEQKDILKKSKRGICGGGLDSLNENENFLKENNIEVKKSKKPEDDFNIIVVNEIKSNKPKLNIYYYYGNHLDD